MYQVGDYFIFGNRRACKIENIGALDLSDMPKDKVYYTLIPCFTKESKVFTPVENDKVIMRPIISKDEAVELIDNIKNNDSIWVTYENAEQLWDTTMDPSKRIFLRVSINEAEKDDLEFTFSTLMGDKVELRRFIETNAKIVRNLDI